MKAKKTQTADSKPQTANINTATPMTWCPGCYNFQILAGVKNYFSSELKKGKSKEDFAICSGIGCQGKIFDYINLNGLNTLHGRELPTSLGIKMGNPNLDVYAFIGDGGCFNEGVSHLVHAARENVDITCIVHNNQVFALTVGQPTGLTEQGFVDKTTPEGVTVKPFNPLKLVLSANATFVARVFADVKQVEWVLNEAKKHKGFKFIEIIQPCIIFHPDVGYKDYVHEIPKSHDVTDFYKAMKLIDDWDYNGIKKGDKINTGIFYKVKRETILDKHWQLKGLVKDKKQWKDRK
ncbi:MAG: thiamine pyrophosphate-dependent enzyme [Nanoarchaeota archaeon]|jgi:2-oxoglutarate ferredoxin oxidoreductase subunit beta|nr:thiamine pyrophosphate-dependent enzyme [Nanoarchaeota archaeon]